MTDKEKLYEYIKAKGMSIRGFCASLGFSKTFMDSGSSFGVDKLKLIIAHPDYSDFPLEWFLYDKGELVLESKPEIPESIKEIEGKVDPAQVSFIINTLQRLEKLKGVPQQDATHQELIQLLENTITNLAAISQDFQRLYNVVKLDYNL